MQREVAAAGIEKPAIIAATKSDEAPSFDHPQFDVVAVSILDDDSLEQLREAIWRLPGLVRVFLPDGDAVALQPPATVVDVARHVHKELARRQRRRADLWPSARFDGQRVGRGHRVADGDVVEVLS